MGDSAEEVRLQKGRMRSFMREELLRLPGERVVQDGAIVGNILALMRNHGPMAALGAFMAIRQEPDVTAAISASLVSGCPVFLPRYVSVSNAYEMVRIRDIQADMLPGKYGILEPATFLPSSGSSAWHVSGMLWLVPGLAFDGQGHRLGRGKGYYDQLLQGSDGVKVGVAYECQLVDAVPSEAHDICMDYVVTESRILAMA